MLIPPLKINASQEEDRMKKKLGIMTAVFFFAAFLLTLGQAQAVQFLTGDVLAGGSFGGQGKVYQIRPGVGLVDTLLTTFTGSEETGMAFQSGNLLVTNWTNSNITKFNNTGAVIAPNPFVSNDAGSHNESIVFDGSGNMYIGQADGTRDVIKRDAAGNFLARYDVATQGRGSDWIDLAADQHTLYYTSEGTSIFRYDVASNTQLPNFADIPGGTCYALRLLPTGGLLVAHASDIKRLDGAGNVIQTYDEATVSQWFALNLDPDGTSFWSADYSGGKIVKFDIATGAVLDSFTAPSNISGLTVVGERTVVIPLPSTFLLLGPALAGLAVLRKNYRG
jgi:sugar lactone lactonase YvrE